MASLKEDDISNSLDPTNAKIKKIVVSAGIEHKGSFCLVIVYSIYNRAMPGLETAFVKKTLCTPKVGATCGFTGCCAGYQIVVSVRAISFHNSTLDM